MLEVEIKVTVEVEYDVRVTELTAVEYAKMEEAAMTAIRNAVRRGEENGFDHPYCAEMSINSVGFERL